MSINLTDEIEVKTKKGKLGAAKQIFLEGDTQTVEKEIQDINSRHNALNTKHESLSRTVQGIAITSGANTATNVTYNNDISGLNAENAQDAIDEVSSKLIYDVSARNNGAVFESLQALLSSSNLSTLIPTSVRHGGMSIRFIQGSVSSSDNKYVQYRLMATSFSTSESDWQGVDDKPTTGSNNLIKSGGVADALKKVSKIEKEIIFLDSEEKISFTDDKETEIYAEIGDFGIKSKNYLDINGNDIVVTKDTEISDLPSTTNVPTSKAVVDYVTEHSVTRVPISEEKTASSEEKVLFTDDEETETYAEISSEGIKAKKYYFLNGTEVKLKNPYYILDASGNGDFTTVAQAISNVPKLGVVLVKPGEYSVKGYTFTKGQRFIGFTNSTECVFYVDDGLYNSAPKVINGYFENLSFESRHKASNTSRRAYCVHIDSITRVQDVPFEVKFINCTFKSWNSDCIGCGGSKDFKLYIENCRLYQYGNDGGTEDARPNWSCFAMHGAANMESTSQYAGPVYVYIKDSVLITYTKSALRFGYDRYTGTDGIIIPGGGEWELINNTLYSYKDNDGVPYGINCVTHGSGQETEPFSSFPIAGTDWTLSPLNHGNNSQVININN